MKLRVLIGRVARQAGVAPDSYSASACLRLTGRSEWMSCRRGEKIP